MGSNHYHTLQLFNTGQSGTLRIRWVADEDEDYSKVIGDEMPCHLSDHEAVVFARDHLHTGLF